MGKRLKIMYHNTKQNTMFNHEHHDNALGFICGIIGGTTKFLLDIPKDGFGLQFIEAIATAFACGVAGVLGKHLVSKMLKKSKK